MQPQPSLVYTNVASQINPERLRFIELVYRRSDLEESLVTVLNISEQKTSLELELTESTLAFATNSDCEIQVKGSQKRIVLPPLGGVVIQ